MRPLLHWMVPIVMTTACCGPHSQSALAPSNPERSGRVHGANGEPLAGVIVNFTDPKTGKLLVEAVTDADGDFSPPKTPGTYAVAAATASGWYSSGNMDVSDAPISLSLGSGCKLYSGSVASAAEHDRRATIRFKRITPEFNEEFAVPVEDGTFRICLPPGDFTVFAAGDLLSVPRLMTDGAGKLSIDAVARSAVLAPAPTGTGASYGVDLETFVERIPAAAQLVAIGESNHGTREFVQLRHDITMQLVRKRGFRLILIEAGFAEALAVNRYIHGEVVDARKAVEGLRYWMWDTEEFLGVLDILRNYNASVSAEARISLWGLDVQRTEASVAVLLTARDVTAREQGLFEKIVPDRGAAWKTFSELDRNVVLKALDRLESDTDKARSLAALALRHRLESVTLEFTADLLHRDVGMAKMALAAAKVAPDGKAVIWAHNAHVAREPIDGFPMMGHHIALSAKSAYFPIALYAAAGHARAWDERGAIGVVPHELPPAPGHSLERALLNTTDGQDGLLIGSELPEDLQRWLSVPHYALEFGSGFDGTAHLRTALVAYSAFGIIASASPTTPTPTGVRKATPTAP